MHSNFIVLTQVGARAESIQTNRFYKHSSAILESVIYSSFMLKCLRLDTLFRQQPTLITIHLHKYQKSN